MGGWFSKKKFEILEFFYYIQYVNDIYVFTVLQKTLKGSRNIQGFALIRAVLFFRYFFAIEDQAVNYFDS